MTVNLTFRPYLETDSYRFGEQILNSKFSVKKEIEKVLNDVNDLPISRPSFNMLLKNEYEKKGWESEPSVFDDLELGARMDFLKQRVGIEIGFSHSSFVGIDLLKFQVASDLDKIDVGVYVLTTKKFQKEMENNGITWKSSLTYEKVMKYLPQFKSAIHVPIYLIGIDIH